MFAFYINIFYYFAIIPTELKKATILPKFKKGNRKSLLNYRPIANISVLAKILERNILTRIKKLAYANNLIGNHQFAYQNNVSLNDAIQIKTHFIYNAFNQNKNVNSY